MYQQSVQSFQSFFISFLLKKRIDDLTRALPTYSFLTAYSTYKQLKNFIKDFKFEIPERKELIKRGVVERPLSDLIKEYLSACRRRSIDYTAASIIAECLCHIMHDFPSTKWGKFEYLDSSASQTISEIPSEDLYKRLAEKLGLSWRDLKAQHKKTMEICRRMYVSELGSIVNYRGD